MIQEEHKIEKSLKILYRFTKVHDLRAFKEILDSFEFANQIESMSHLSEKTLINEVKNLLCQIDTQKVLSGERTLDSLRPVFMIICEVNLDKKADWSICDTI